MYCLQELHRGFNVIGNYEKWLYSILCSHHLRPETHWLLRPQQVKPTVTTGTLVSSVPFCLTFNSVITLHIFIEI